LKLIFEKSRITPDESQSRPALIIILSLIAWEVSTISYSFIFLCKFSPFPSAVSRLNSMSGSMHAEEREYGQRFCHQIFQVEEYRELAAGILLHLSPAGTSQQMLRDLILANHFFLFLMEKSVRDGELRKIQRKKAQRKRKAVQSQRYKSEGGHNGTGDLGFWHFWILAFSIFGILFS
jgi:hypothetical protein